MAVGSPAFVPDPNPSEQELFYNTIHKVFINPEVQTQQTFRRDGLWEIMWNWVAIEEDLALPLLAKINAYRNNALAFTTYDIGRPHTRGVATQANMNGLVVDGGGQTGMSIDVMGGIPCRNKLLFKAGDVIGFGTQIQMLEVAADCTADDVDAGTATIQLCQHIRNSPINITEQIITSFVPVRVQIIEAVRPTISDAPPHYTFTVKLREVLA